MLSEYPCFSRCMLSCDCAAAVLLKRGYESRADLLMIQGFAERANLALSLLAKCAVFSPAAAPANSRDDVHALCDET